MLILSNGLTTQPDEGFLNVANSLAKRIKNTAGNVKVISYDRQSLISDVHLNLNKLLLSRKLRAIVAKSGEDVLYIPFPAKTIATALRIFVLSLYAKKRVDVVLVLKNYMNFFARTLVKLSGANLVVFSKDSQDFYSDFLPKKRVKYLKTGVDTQRFAPVDKQKSEQLKQKYGFKPNQPVVLHVGHLKSGRNVGQLLKLSQNYQVILVASTMTQDEQDEALKTELLNAPNIKVMTDYVPHIEEIYQMCDVYFFPTTELCNCIDVPLSCMEAAACNKPIVTTNFGEMREFAGKEGFCFIDDFTPESLNQKVEKALNMQSCNTRAAVLEYDWNKAVKYLAWQERGIKAEVG
ncbi:MAG: glycosyltransferase family 4 protein [Oscillospiraceae bacterium]|jgi:glycosyltransferase involved in cell wall biosynthesis|nr:glycosyltransferase family 4 protein [Oscillospiraceae bacterium]